MEAHVHPSTRQSRFLGKQKLKIVLTAKWNELKGLERLLANMML